MATSVQAITLSSVADGSGAFVVSGVFWLTAPANSIVPLPTFKSAVAGIAPADLAVLRSGTAIEVTFSTPIQPAATTQATVDALIQTMLTAAQTALTNSNPGLSTAVLRAFNGSTWGAFGGVVGPLPVGVPPQITNPLFFAIPQGLVPTLASGRSFGYAAAASAAGTRILATAYSPAAPGVAAQRSMNSSSANDAAAGTGARTVTITYLTTAFVLKSETVTLNGATAVNTVGTDIAYIESIAIGSCGSGLTNAGTISLFNATAGGGGTLGSIATGDGQTNWAHHYVPAGVTCYLINVSGGASLAAGRFFLNHTGDPSQSVLPILPVGGQYPHLLGGNEDHTFQVPVAIKGPDRIFLTEFPNTATASNTAFGSFEWVQG